jgi:GT2 family glycosyltransferase
VALAYGKQRGGPTTQFAERRVFAQWFPDESNLRQNHPFCNNANAAIRRSLWEETPYDEDLTGLEDLDWAKRAIAAGHHLAYIAEAEVVHVHDETPRQIYNRYRREAIAFKRIFPQERFHFADFLRLWVLNVATDYSRALRRGVLRCEWLGIPRFRLMQFLGTYRGYAYQKPITQPLRRTFYYPNRRQTEAKSFEAHRRELRIHYEALDDSVIESSTRPDSD